MRALNFIGKKVCVLLLKKDFLVVLNKSQKFCHKSQKGKNYLLQNTFKCLGVLISNTGNNEEKTVSFSQKLFFNEKITI